MAPLTTTATFPTAARGQQLAVETASMWFDLNCKTAAEPKGHVTCYTLHVCGSRV